MNATQVKQEIEILVFLDARYELVFVIVHHGRVLDSGRYTSYVKVGNDWFCVDDTVFYKTMDEAKMFQKLRAARSTNTSYGLVYKKLEF